MFTLPGWYAFETNKTLMIEELMPYLPVDGL